MTNISRTRQQKNVIAEVNPISILFKQTQCCQIISHYANLLLIIIWSGRGIIWRFLVHLN